MFGGSSARVRWAAAVACARAAALAASRVGVPWRIDVLGLRAVDHFDRRPLDRDRLFWHRTAQRRRYVTRPDRLGIAPLVEPGSGARDDGVRPPGEATQRQIELAELARDGDLFRLLGR